MSVRPDEGSSVNSDGWEKESDTRRRFLRLAYVVGLGTYLIALAFGPDLPRWLGWTLIGMVVGVEVISGLWELGIGKFVDGAHKGRLLFLTLVMVGVVVWYLLA